jgi:hypothetical protein
MTLAEAFHLLAAAGCRLDADPAGGLALTVPEGAVVPAGVLDVLRANREQLVAALAPASPPAPAVDDLRDYLGTKGVAGPAADLVERAVDVFGIRHDRITVEQDGAGEPEPTFFEPGIPCRTTADTLWHESGHGYREVPAGTSPWRSRRHGPSPTRFSGSGLTGPSNRPSGAAIGSMSRSGWKARPA